MAPAQPAQPTTILQGPLPYDKPKGLAALLLPVLCPPSDTFDMQRLTKALIGLVIRLSTVVAAVSFALVPAWLWLIRHELHIGHTVDGQGLAVGGLLFFLFTDAVKRTAARANAARQSGVFSAASKGAYQVVPGRYTAVAAVPPASSTGTATSGQSAGAAGYALRGSGTAAAPSRSASAAVARSGAGLANGSASHGPGHHASASAVDPMVRQVKQRIIKLERALFGNELTEADISRDALHSRVQMLCTEVGVPFGGPGASSARPSAAELDQQLVAVERALGI